MSEIEAAKAWIDQATTEQLLGRWRFAPAGDPYFQGALGDYFARVISARRDADPAELFGVGPALALLALVVLRVLYALVR